jgi:ADP-dependent NAD(P)H-hydrate dehydratase / NAD(P)H-hydrate epimerase
MKVSNVDEMKNLDRMAVEEFGIPPEILMENAGNAAYFVILKEFGIKNKRFVVFCGAGNNGGDGFVTARKIYSSGGDVRVFLLSEKERFKGHAKKNFEIISSFPLEIKPISKVKDIESDILWADAVVDAIFGIGLDREVTGIYKEVISLINKSRRKVFSIDIPSGINGDNGQEMGISVKADYTVTFGLPKLGSILYPGYGRCGKLYLSHISFPPSHYNSDWLKTEITQPIPLPERNANTTKMDYGPVLFIAGAQNYNWAPVASAYSFLKSGGGYSFLACPESMVPFLAGGGREVVFQPQRETDSGSIALSNKGALLELSERVKMVVLGPGLSLNEETQRLVRELAGEIEKPLLIDGDGITAVAQDTKIIRERKAETILTPHIGEMARLTKRQRSEIEGNRISILQETCEQLNAIIVLKGPHSLIGYPDQRVFINPSGDTKGKAGMATAGSGDVLNGVIPSMFSLGLESEEAVRIGVLIHGIAGDLAAKEKGADGMTAKDILNFLPYAVKHYRENTGEIAETLWDTIHII